MAVTIVKSNATVPTIPNDSYPGTNSYLFSVYQNVPFSMDLTFSLFDEIDPPGAIAITSVNSSFSTYSSVTFTVANTDPYAYKITVSGNLNNVITGESYILLLEDNTLLQAPVSNLPDYVAVVEWTLPGVYSQSISTYNFVVSDGVSNTNVNMSQYVYWNYEIGITNFRQDIAGGL